MGCGGDGSPVSDRTAEPNQTVTGAENRDRVPETAELYFTSGEQFRKVERRVPRGGGPLAAVAEALVAGPSARERQAGFEAQTQIPADTEVEGVSLEEGVAVVALSEEFSAGIPADPSARSPAEQLDLSARLAQLTFTLTQYERVEEAKLLVGGEPLQAPQTLLSRQDYAEPDQGPVRKQRPRGEKSKSTEQIQKRLAALRYLPKSAVDGLDGYRTEQAILAFQSWEGLERDGIVGPATSAALAEARKPKPGADGPSRRIEVYNQKGVTLLIKSGITKRAIHTSSGAPGYETPTGSYEVFRKELRSWSVPYSVWLPYASYFNQGIAFHEYAEVPTFPASHGCVRVPAPEAKIVYRFASVGTAVVVI